MALSQYLLLRILLKKCMQLKIYHVICSYVCVWFAIGNKKDACLLKSSYDRINYLDGAEYTTTYTKLTAIPIDIRWRQ